MREIPLSNGLVALVDDEDADLLMYSWTGFVNASGMTYAQKWRIRDGRKSTITMHRFILERIAGRTLQRHELADHKDTNGLNNRRSNLRVTDTVGNGGNRRINANNRTGFKGVSATGYKDPQKQFKAQCGGILVGVFPTAEEAHAAYCEAARLTYGEFANFGTHLAQASLSISTPSQTQRTSKNILTAR